MAHVVAEPCFDCKYTDCVVVCPVDCFYEGAQMLYIHPEECIDCEACVPECPVEAIFHEDNLPDEWKDFTALNAEESPQVPGHHREERRPRRRELHQEGLSRPDRGASTSPGAPPDGQGIHPGPHEGWGFSHYGPE